VGLLAGLALVLGLVALLTRLLKGIQASGRLRPAAALEVVARTGLAPRQGVAVVRVDDRRVLVGYGEGGVRLLAELRGGEVLEARNGREDTAPDAWLKSASGTRRGPGLLLALAFGLAAAGGALVPSTAAAHDMVGLVSLVAPGVAAPEPAGAPGSALVAVPGGPALEPAQTPVPSPAQTPAAGPQLPAPVSGDAAGLLQAHLPQLGFQVGTEDGEGMKLSGPVGVVVFLGFLTLLPTLLLLMTSFTRILVVLHFLKQAIGTQTAPPAHLLAALALLLTGFVMAPTLSEANRVAIDPWVRGDIDEATMLRTAAGPFRDFMLRSVREQDLAAFVEMSSMEAAPASPADVPLVVLASAFVISELRAAFQMGFALFLPFVVIDLVVASVLMSMGMFMLPPVMVSLPFKLLLFVMVDGWALVVGSLVRSFA
jgi:flagellar biosynthetic protein FliP